MFGTDVGMIQLPGLTHCKLKYLLGSRGIREIRTGRGRRLPLLDRLLDPLLDLVQVHIQVGEHCGRHTLPFAYQPEENVLRTNVFVVQTGSFFSRHLQNLANSVGEVVTVHSISRVINADDYSIRNEDDESYRVIDEAAHQRVASSSSSCRV